ncbi:MAG: hypothetical protein ACOYM3_20705 [Terrimicrobiaceae bacterium]
MRTNLFFMFCFLAPHIAVAAEQVTSFYDMDSQQSFPVILTHDQLLEQTSYNIHKTPLPVTAEKAGAIALEQQGRQSLPKIMSCHTELIQLLRYQQDVVEPEIAKYLYIVKLDMTICYPNGPESRTCNYWIVFPDGNASFLKTQHK